MVDEALERLTRRRVRLVALARRWSADSASAEDLVQTALGRALVSGIPDGASPERWLSTVMRNLAVDRSRAARRESALKLELSTEPSPPSLPERAKPCPCAGQELEHIRPAYAEAIREIDLQGEAIPDFARRRGITSNNATVRLHRARRALKTALERRCGHCAGKGCFNCTCGSVG